jgi:hypothetical protein
MVIYILRIIGSVRHRVILKLVVPGAERGTPSLVPGSLERVLNGSQVAAGQPSCVARYSVKLSFPAERLELRIISRQEKTGMICGISQLRSCTRLPRSKTGVCHSPRGGGTHVKVVRYL